MNSTDYLTFPVLKTGMSTPHVALVKALLRSQGAWTGTDGEEFGPKLKAAVQYFQGTHLGPQGAFLKGDGEVGPMTWWALYNPTGIPQKSFIKQPSKDDTGVFGRYAQLSKSRQDLLRVLFAEHAAGTHEIPDGSNQGDGVDKFITGYGAVPWCALFQSWAWKESHGDWPQGGRQGHVQTWWNLALKSGYAERKGKGYKPIPGDLAVWCFSGGTGHITAVVAVDEKAAQFNSIGGNEGNRVKLGLRTIANEPRLAGFINLHADRDDSFRRGLLSVSEEKALAEGSTR